MSRFETEGTSFSFTILPQPFLTRKDRLSAVVGLQNEYVHYEKKFKNTDRDELEKWIFCMFRLLAGAYGTEYSISLDELGFAVDLYPHTENGKEVSRQKRRENDCVMAIRFLMCTADEARYLGGVYTLLLHREDIEKFASALRQEFAGVSPFGYTGCNYWYFDPSGYAKKGGFVWVRMGRHNLEQIVYVDSVRRFTQDTLPYDIENMRKILRKATEEELAVLGVDEKEE